MPAPAFLVLWQLSGVVALRSWGPLLGEGAGGAKTRAERPAAARAAAAAAAAVAISWPAVRPRVGIPPDPCCCCLLPPAAADLRSVRRSMIEVYRLSGTKIHHPISILISCFCPWSIVSAR
jgi:hypothetical protein